MTTITALMDPSRMPNQSQDQATFDANWAYVLENILLRGQQENALAANLNAIAAGGAYAIPFRFYPNPLTVGGRAGNLSPGTNGVALNVATQIIFDQVDARGLMIKGMLDDIFYAGATSASKGHIKLTKVGDASKWVSYRVDSWLFIPGSYPYGLLNIVCVGYSSENPFADGDQIVMHCQRTGDKGDAGSLTPVLWVRDEKSSGQSGGTSSANQRRTLNTVKKNTISGASLSGDVITLPPGTYRISATAPAYNSGAHRAYASITANGVTISIDGQTAYSPAPSIILMSEFVVSTTATVSIQHLFGTTVPNGLGLALGAGGTEVYTDVFIEKVS